jgi:hypothetical protein
MLSSNYAFKPTAGEVCRSNQSLRAGGGLTRRWAAYVLASANRGCATTASGSLSRWCLLLQCGCSEEGFVLLRRSRQ